MKFPALTSIAAGALLVSCAPRQTVVWQPGVELAKSVSAPTPASEPRTVRLEQKVRLRSKGRTMNFDAVLVADSTRGRMEALGPFGMSLATLVWQDTSWQLWLPSQNAMVRGSGDSLALPIVGMKTFRPRELVAPYLGRGVGSITGQPLRRVGGDKQQSLLVPIEPQPGWAIAIDRRSGLPIYKQILRNGRESERFGFGGWRLRDGLPVPDSIVRTGSDSQRIDIRLTSWETIDSLPPSVFSIQLEKPVDTIVVIQDGIGRRRFQIRPAGGAPASPAAETFVDSLSGSDEAIDESSPEDSTDVPEDDPSGLEEEDELLPGNE